jgi:hypothetical protein
MPRLAPARHHLEAAALTTPVAPPPRRDHNAPRLEHEVHLGPPRAAGDPSHCCSRLATHVTLHGECQPCAQHTFRRAPGTERCDPHHVAVVSLGEDRRTRRGIEERAAAGLQPGACRGRMRPRKGSVKAPEQQPSGTQQNKPGRRPSPESASTSTPQHPRYARGLRASLPPGTDHVLAGRRDRADPKAIRLISSTT